MCWPSWETSSSRSQAWVSHRPCLVCLSTGKLKETHLPQTKCVRGSSQPHRDPAHMHHFFSVSDEHSLGTCEQSVHSVSAGIWVHVLSDWHLPPQLLLPLASREALVFCCPQCPDVAKVQVFREIFCTLAACLMFFPQTPCSPQAAYVTFLPSSRLCIQSGAQLKTWEAFPSLQLCCWR